MAVANVSRARNLQKSQLGGVVFGCTNDTMSECLTRQLFGLPARHFLYVKNIEQGVPLFLFNYSGRKLHGIYEAASSGKMNIDPYAWTEDGSDKTKYPAQVQIRVRLQCQALVEHQFKPIIADNYYSPTHFWFELDHFQANKLMAELSSSAIGLRPVISESPQKWRAVKKKLPFDDKREESGPSEPLTSTDNFANSFDSTEKLVTSDDSQCWDGNIQLEEESAYNQNYQMIQADEKDLIYMKLKELAHTHDQSVGHVFEAASTDATDTVDLEHETPQNAIISSGNGNNENSFSSLDYPAIIAQLSGEMKELRAFKQEQTLKIETLKKKLVESEQNIHQLKNRCAALESISNPSPIFAGDELLIESSEFDLNLKESILIVGGHDGISWSSALHSFSPSRDVLRSLKPMSSVRGYASVVSLDGKLYVIGGGTDSMWYDSVESYDAVSSQWTPCPPLNKKKGSLAVAALNGIFFAVGGGNGVECFSEVELFDPNIGKWIFASSMLQKRFALAAVEFQGAIYAVGGYNRNNYLKSAERFDPREHSWTRIGSMDTNRGSHSLVVANEKLYAIGGHDGTTMLPSVEIYDPRLDTWMTGEPMNQSRGYLAAAVLNETIYAIGGYAMGGLASDKEHMVDTIECFKEGQGWQETNSRAVGKRCYASAIVLGGD